MATFDSTRPLDLLGAHVRGSYRIEHNGSSWTFTFDGIVESVVVNLEPGEGVEFLVGSDFHCTADCDVLEIVAPASTSPYGRLGACTALRAH